jgi:hypothetical protein
MSGAGIKHTIPDEDIPPRLRLSLRQSTQDPTIMSNITKREVDTSRIVPLEGWASAPADNKNAPKKESRLRNYFSALVVNS